MPPWPSGQGVGQLNRRLRARIPQGLLAFGRPHPGGIGIEKEVIWHKMSKEHARSLAAWASGMILAQGARGPRFSSRSSPFLLPRRIDMQTKRQRGDSNPCGQSPMDFESISLTARTHCHGLRKRNSNCKESPSALAFVLFIRRERANRNRDGKRTVTARVA